MGDEKKATGAEAGPATKTLVTGAPNSPAAQSVLSNDALSLQTQGFSGPGAMSLLTGTPLTNPVDQIQAQTIMTQMQADAQKQQMERWKIMQDTQAKIFEIQQDVTVNKAKTQDKAFQKWDAYIRG